MKSFRLLLGLVFKTLLGFVSLVIIYLLVALLLSLIPTGNDSPQAEANTAVFVRTNGVHTDFILPVQSSTIHWSSLLPYHDFGKADSTFQYIAFGWGDKGFYLNTPNLSDLTCSTAFNALFFRSTTAMHVTYIQHLPKEDNSCRRILLTENQYRLLSDYIQKSFQTSESGGFRLITGKGYGVRDNFYEAWGTYSFLRTCNVWTGQGLQQINVRTSVWSPFDKGILYYLPTAE